MKFKTTAAITADLRKRNLLDLVRGYCEKNHVTVDEVLGRSRLKLISKVRRQIWHELHLKGMSYPQIGLLFNRDHTTVIEGIRRLGVSKLELETRDR